MTFSGGYTPYSCVSHRLNHCIQVHGWRKASPGFVLPPTDQNQPSKSKQCDTLRNPILIAVAVVSCMIIGIVIVVLVVRWRTVATYQGFIRKYQLTLEYCQCDHMSAVISDFFLMWTMKRRNEYIELVCFIISLVSIPRIWSSLICIVYNRFLYAHNNHIYCFKHFMSFFLSKIRHC